MKQTSHAILYVNFSPYTNAGSILDFLLDQTDELICFTFHFYSLGKKQSPPEILLYKNRKVIKRNTLFQIPVPLPLLFLLLPLRSVLLFIQIIIFTLLYKPYITKPLLYITVNGFTAWIGVVLKSFGLVQRTIFWVWDYYPPVHHNIFIAVMRNLYTVFDNLSLAYTDKIVFLNKRIAHARNYELHFQNKPLMIVPIGTTLKKGKPEHNSIVFFGVLKHSQGINLALDLLKKHKNFTLHIIGNGPDRTAIEKNASQCVSRIIFHGYITDDKKIDTIISRCSIGIAPYLPLADSVTPYTDPSKLKRYLSCGLPVITTPVTEFSEEIKKYGAGIIIDPDTHSLYAAIKKIQDSYQTYRKNAYTLAKQYEYSNIYPALLE